MTCHLFVTVGLRIWPLEALLAAEIARLNLDDASIPTAAPPGTVEFPLYSAQQPSRHGGDPVCCRPFIRLIAFFLQAFVYRLIGDPVHT
jgi:hypothetical protein